MRTITEIQSDIYITQDWRSQSWDPMYIHYCSQRLERLYKELSEAEAQGVTC